MLIPFAWMVFDTALTTTTGLKSYSHALRLSSFSSEMLGSCFSKQIPSHA